MRGRPPKTNVEVRDNGTNRLSALATDPMVREFLDNYWKEDPALVAIPKDPKKTEAIKYLPPLNKEEAEQYREEKTKELKEKEQENKMNDYKQETQSTLRHNNNLQDQIQDFKSYCIQYEKIVKNLILENEELKKTIEEIKEQSMDQQVTDPMLYKSITTNHSLHQANSMGNIPLPNNDPMLGQSVVPGATDYLNYIPPSGVGGSRDPSFNENLPYRQNAFIPKFSAIGTAHIPPNNYSSAPFNSYGRSAKANAITNITRGRGNIANSGENGVQVPWYRKLQDKI